MHKVKIMNGEPDKIFPTYVFVDGQSIKAKSVSFNQSLDTVPTCEIEINALPDIEALADIKFQFTPQTIQEAAKVLRHSLITDSTLYGAFCMSIESALKEIPAETKLCDTAKSIADRIIDV